MNDKKGSPCRPCASPTPPMLVGEISRLFGARMRRQDPEGVMMQDSARLLMRELSHEDGVSQLHLTTLTHLKAPTVSVTLRRMESEGLVRREQDPMDLRVTRVFLTERGKEHNRAVHERLRLLDAQMMEGFTETECATLTALLERMRDNMLPQKGKKNTVD